MGIFFNKGIYSPCFTENASDKNRNKNNPGPHITSPAKSYNRYVNHPSYFKAINLFYLLIVKKIAAKVTKNHAIKVDQNID